MMSLKKVGRSARHSTAADNRFQPSSEPHPLSSRRLWLIVAVHWALTAAGYHWHAFGNLVKGHSRQIVRDGEILEDAMRQSHLSEHDLEEQLRLNGNVDDLKQVKAAWKERNGEISVVKKS